MNIAERMPEAITGINLWQKYPFAAAPIDPSTIAGLKLWLKADAITGKNDNDPLSAWNDSSANGYNLLASGLNPPNYRTNIVNGKPVVRFLAALQNAMVGGGDMLIGQPDTIFVVGKGNVASTNCAFIWTTGASVQNFILTTPAGLLYMNSQGGAGFADAVDHSGAFHVFTGIYNGVSSSSRVDGSQVASGDVSVSGVGTFRTMFTGSEWSTGDIAEILLYNSALSTTDRQNVEAYLKAKYGTP